jgi:hypothetical protein
MGWRAKLNRSYGVRLKSLFFNLKAVRGVLNASMSQLALHVRHTSLTPVWKMD